MKGQKNSYTIYESIGHMIYVRGVANIDVLV